MGVRKAVFPLFCQNCFSFKRWFGLFAVQKISAQDAVEKLSASLEQVDAVKVPEWFGTVKSSTHSERVPDSPKLWYKRVAALLRNVVLNGGVGVRRLRNKFGGRKEHTVGRAHHRKAGGKAIRLGLQQLEKAGFLKKEKAGGRTITDAGLAFIEKACK